MSCRRICTAAIVAAISISAVTAATATTASKRYALPLTPAYETKALLSVGDSVPWATDRARSYQMVGIPDGLGAHGNRDESVTLYMNHEFNSNVRSDPLVGGPGYRGSYVSRFILDEEGDPIEGKRAFDFVFSRDTYVGPAAQDDNATRAFARFCSGFLAGPREGFDRYIYLTGEESGAPTTFDTKGGSVVALFGDEAHVLPDLGHLPWENAIVMRDTGRRTVIMAMEDGPSSPDSQLWMYVGVKDRSTDSVLERNGLVGGKLFVFAGDTHDGEVTFQQGTIRGNWEEIPGGGDQSEATLESLADSEGAFGFIRPEDGAFDKRHSRTFYFVTTGGGTGNQLGRLYQLRLGEGDPSDHAARLRVIYNADQVTASGRDIAVSPDNIDTNRKYLMVQEDGTTQSREWMASQGRDGSIWRFKLSGDTPAVDWTSALRVAELDPPGRDGRPVGPGVWETSGIIDATKLFDGHEVWLFDVQAHQPTQPSIPARQVEDGQLLLLWDVGRDEDRHDEDGDDDRDDD